MTDIVLDDIKSGYNLQKINDNFEKIEDNINRETIQRRNGSNVMEQDLDMNSKRILNSPAPVDPTHLVRLGDLTSGSSSLEGTFTKYLISVIAGQTVLTVPEVITKAIVFIDGVMQSEASGAYSFTAGETTITLSEALIGDEIVEVWINNLVVTTPVNAIADGKHTLEDFGAIGNGLVDDTSAVNTAFASGIPINGTYGNTYLITGQLAMPNGLDFNGRGCNFIWNGVAGAITYEGRDWGVFSAIGTLGDVIDTHVLTSPIAEFEEDSYPVDDINNFSGRDDTYMFVFAGSTSSNPELPSFANMPKFIGTTSGTTVAIDYRCGWEIPSGLSITYREVTPVRDIKLRNFTIEDQSPVSGDTSDYASAISLAFAYNCQVENVNGIKFRNPILFAQYCTDCLMNTGRVERPQATGGGQGYHTQWSYSLRCDTNRITGYEARHLSDHTKSSYCNVYNCGDSNTADGAFTNHGAYEHDISYYNCVGIHSLANSGPTFGQSIARVHIENGRGSDLIGIVNVIDLTVINSHFGKARVNSQGFQAYGLTVDDDGTTATGFEMNSFTISDGRATLSKRPNVINDSSLAFNSGQSLTDASFTGKVVYLNNTELRKINSGFIETGKVKMIGGSIAGTTSALSLGADASIELYGTDTDSFGVRHLDGTNNSTFIVDGGEHTSIVTTGFYSNRMLTGTAKVEIRNTTIDAASGLLIDMPNASGTNEIFMDFTHNTFSNGTIEIKNIYSGAGKLMLTNNLFDTMTFTTAITTAGRRLNTDNITV